MNAAIPALFDADSSMPEGWGKQNLSTLAAVGKNAVVGGPFGSDLVSKDYTPSGVPVIRGQNMGEKFVGNDFVYVSNEKAKSIWANTAKPNDIIFTQRGTLGQVSIVPIRPYPRYVISQSQMKITLDKRKCDPFYIWHFFNSTQQQQVILSSAIQTGVPHINLKIMREFSVSVPPLPEQQAIATALNDIDDLIASLDALIAKKRDIKQAAMQQLLTGNTRLPGFEEEWKVAKLSQIAKIQRGASPRPIDSPKWFDDNSSIGWVRISDVTRSGIKLTETTQRLSAAGIQHSRFVPNGSLIMSICATIGRPIITSLDVCIHDGFVVFDELKVEKDFLYFVLKNIEGEWSKMGQTGSQMNLNTGMINGKEISLPVDRDEQAAIAKIALDMEAEIIALQSKEHKARTLRRGMMQQLLTGRIRLV